MDCKFKYDKCKKKKIKTLPGDKRENTFMIRFLNITEERQIWKVMMTYLIPPLVACQIPVSADRS